MGCKYVKEFEFGSDKGFTGSAGKTQVKGYARGGKCKMAEGGMAGYKKGGKFDAKMGKVMKEFGKGELHSGKNRPVVKNPKQAVAIAYSEARKSTKK